MVSNGTVIIKQNGIFDAKAQYFLDITDLVNFTKKKVNQSFKVNGFIYEIEAMLVKRSPISPYDRILSDQIYQQFKLCYYEGEKAEYELKIGDSMSKVIVVTMSQYIPFKMTKSNQELKEEAKKRKEEESQQKKLNEKEEIKKLEREREMYLKKWEEEVEEKLKKKKEEGIIAYGFRSLLKVTTVGLVVLFFVMTLKQIDSFYPFEFKTSLVAFEFLKTAPSPFFTTSCSNSSTMNKIQDQSNENMDELISEFKQQWQKGLTEMKLDILSKVVLKPPRCHIEVGVRTKDGFVIERTEMDHTGWCRFVDEESWAEYCLLPENNQDGTVTYRPARTDECIR